MLIHSTLGPVALSCAPTPDAAAAGHILLSRFEFAAVEDAGVVLVLGGDGFMLSQSHLALDRALVGHMAPALYGLNYGSVGFLMNRADDGRLLEERLETAVATSLHPLLLQAVDMTGAAHQALGINDVALFRERNQTAHLEVAVNGTIQLPELIGDGLLVATPAGSTAYNSSVRGPIVPLGSGVLALTPISPFRPRRWTGALLPDDAVVEVSVLDPEKRPVSATADHFEVRDVVSVSIALSRLSLTVMFDPGHSLESRILAEQFTI